MILVIDGYNVLKHIDPYRTIDDHERAHFINELKRYARRKKHNMVLVFDGGEYRWPHKEQVDGVKIIYSGGKKTADEVIMEYLYDHKMKDLLLVSSDHELNLFASKHGVASIGSDDFYRLLKEGLQEHEQGDGQVVVNIDEEERDLDTLMEQASQTVPQKQDDVAPSQVRGHRAKGSKQERILLKKLKKL